MGQGDDQLAAVQEGRAQVGREGGGDAADGGTGLGGQGLGSQVPEATWRDLLAEAGFGRVRRATETPFNLVFEARL